MLKCHMTGDGCGSGCGCGAGAGPIKAIQLYGVDCGAGYEAELKASVRLHGFQRCKIVVWFEELDANYIPTCFRKFRRPVAPG
jgi:hypothetical protein